MTEVAAALDPFVPVDRGVDEPDRTRAALRAAGPVVRVEAPAGGPVWIVTDEAVARAALVDPRITKDPAWAPTAWDPRLAGLEPPAAAVPSLTTLDGPAHATLRQAHAPLFTARRLRSHYGRMTELARELLTALAGGEPVDLTADFTARYPVAVLLELLGVPADRVDDAMGACREMFGGPEAMGRAIATFADLAAAGLVDGRRGMAVELRDRVPAEITRDQLHYLLFGLIFPGQITTDPALGFVLADVLDGDRAAAELDDLVRETLRHHPPAPLTLWRFTRDEIEQRHAPAPARAGPRRHPRHRDRSGPGDRIGPDVRGRPPLLPRRAAGLAGAAGGRRGGPQRVPARTARRAEDRTAAGGPGRHRRKSPRRVARRAGTAQVVTRSTGPHRSTCSRPSLRVARVIET
jgi:cytochrome P450